MDQSPTYRFRWSNVDLQRYCASRRAVADMKRREAQILITRAEQIEEELAELETSLVPAAAESEFQTPETQKGPG